MRVLVAGAGLAGLTAARDLAAHGADVIVVDARDRVGGRVLTLRDGFAGGQRAEAGGEMIDEDQVEIRRLAGELGLKLVRIFRDGFGQARPDAKGRVRIVRRQVTNGWGRLAERLSSTIEPYRLSERRWDSPIAASIARQSVAEWLDRTGADRELRDTASAMRGFFLADPEELSLIALVDQYADWDATGPGRMYRIKGGNDQLAAALAAPLGDRLHLNTALVAVSHRGRGVRATVRHQGRSAHVQADYLVFALPTSLLTHIAIAPALPPPQRKAIAQLKYGRATKTLVQFSRRFWRAPGQPRALGSPLPFGAVWDGNEEQRGGPGILALMAGGSASDATQKAIEAGGIGKLVGMLDWLGSKRATVVSWRQTVWEDDPWVKGGYAFFDPAFDPSLRQWLARPFGRLFFAGEHTSIRWQGYMNGAIESGRRAAAEILAVDRDSSLRSSG